MSELNYAPIPRRTRESIQEALLTGNPSSIHDALLSVAYWDDDWRWAQQQLVNFAESDDEKVLWAVALGLGYVAVFHGEIEEEKVRPILSRISSKPNLTDVAQESLEEIDHFVTRRRAGESIPLGQRLPEDWRPPGGRVAER